MKKESSLHTVCGEPTARITRAQAAAFRTSNAANLTKPLPLTKVPPTKPEIKITRGRNSKKPLEENNHAVSSAVALPSKRKIALRDVTNVALKNVTNICRDGSYENCMYKATVQPRKLQRAKLGPSKAKLGPSKGPSKAKLGPSKTKHGTSTKVSKLAVAVAVENQLVEGDEKDKLTEEVQIAGNSTLPDEVSGKQGDEFLDQQKEESIHDLDSTIKVEACEAQEGMISCKHVNIDSDDSNPQMCSIYAAEIYANLRVHELDERPYSDFMETIQRDITQSMRAILIDWLVEVAEEYKLVPDTLYLTVHILDQFLSQNYIERQRLQLLGITCMLIASKYEEICAPRVEEFCFITDNTYTAEDVRKMEKQVLNHMGFRLSVPTVKTFLRRFLRAAQASYEAPTLVLEFMANYLVELTLVEYAFLKFTPSVIAASAVFLARWTLDPSVHPWNSTLEHYTCYKTADLKATVSEMHGLQKNSKCCPLRAIREKYRQRKFKYVANLPSQEPLPPFFIQNSLLPSIDGC